MAPVSRLANLAENVCKAKVLVPYSSLLVEDVHFEGNHQSSILEFAIFRNCLFKFHPFNAFSTSGSRKRLVASMDLRIALNLEPPNAVLLKRYRHLLQAARGECGGNQRANCVKICVESCFEICCELVVNAVQKNTSSARFTSRFTSSLVENSIWGLSCTTKRGLVSSV